MPKVTIYTQVYNAGEYLKPCLDSVINQTDPDWQWILVDSCSTDGSPAMIDKYAEGDPRIIPIHMPENRLDVKTGYIQQYATGKYIATLDHDDWWELDYIERLYKFAEENDLDYAMTGVEQYYQTNHTSKLMRALGRRVVFTVEDYAKNYPTLGPFSGAQWANLIRLDRYLDVATHPEKQRSREKGIVWRSDTLYMLDHIENSRRIGIDDSVLYHYRRHGNSQVAHYDDTFFKSNLVFYEKLQAFLDRHGALDEEMRGYLKDRHLFEMVSTLWGLRMSDLPAEKKLQTCAEIADHPLTAHALTQDCDNKVTWWQAILAIFIDEFLEGQMQDPDAAKNILGKLSPQCANMLSSEGLELLYLKWDELLPLFAADDWRAINHQILVMLEKNQFNKRLNLLDLFRGLLPEETPLSRIQDPHFFKRHAKITSLVLDEDYSQALEEMTGELLQKEKLYAEEDYLQLYLTMAALGNQVSAFLYGKVRLAKLYQREDRPEDCRAVLAELEEMGAGDIEGAAEVRAALERRKPPARKRPAKKR